MPPEAIASAPSRHPDAFNSGDLLGSAQTILNEARSRMEYLSARVREIEEEQTTLGRIIRGHEEALGVNQIQASNGMKSAR